MDTKIAKAEDAKKDHIVIQEAADLIKAGELVAFPTETVYGLGADALNPQAARRIYAAKGRPSDNPLIVHIARMEDLWGIATDVPLQAQLLGERFWPGPLTMIFPKNGRIPLETTGGLDTVAVRMPNHPIALALIEASTGFVAAPSANTSGRPSPTTAAHVYEDMRGRIPLVLDGGPVGIGIESTIVDFSGETPTILRPGFITQAQLREVLGEVEMDHGLAREDGLAGEDTRRPKAPGMKYRHYAPKAEMVLVSGDSGGVAERILSLAREAVAQGKRVGIIAAEESRAMYERELGVAGVAVAQESHIEREQEPSKGGMAGVAVAQESRIEREQERGRGMVFVRGIGSRSHEAEIARNLYAVLREFDGLGVDVIYSECFFGEGIGEAIMNRMIKAAGHHVIEV